MYITRLARLYFPEEFRIFQNFPIVPSGTTFLYATRKRKSNAKGTSYLPRLQLIYICISYISLPKHLRSFTKKQQARIKEYKLQA